MTKQSTLQPFAPGDIFIGATDLNNPNDDHAGEGRIFQYDKDFNEKGVLYTKGTTHLVLGLTFAPDGVLWAFDTSTYAVLHIDPKTATQRPLKSYGTRSYSGVCFAKDGSFFLNEHITGTLDDVPEQIRANYHTMPGSDRIGDGNIYKFNAGGDLVETYETETSTSFAGFLGATSMALHASEKYITYTTETSKRIMRYDIVNHRQMADLYTLPAEAREFVFCLEYMADGTLAVTRGAKVELIDEEGQVVRTYPLEGRGWAGIHESHDRTAFFITNFLEGRAIKLDKDSGEIVNALSLNIERALAGLAEYPG